MIARIPMATWVWRFVISKICGCNIDLLLVIITEIHHHNHCIMSITNKMVIVPTPLLLSWHKPITLVTSQFNKRLGPICWKSAFAIGPLTIPRLHRKSNLFISEKLNWASLYFCPYLCIHKLLISCMYTLIKLHVHAFFSWTSMETPLQIKELQAVICR